MITAPESVLKATPERAIRMPDVIVSFYGLRTVIEGEVGDTAEAESKAMASARNRVAEGIAHIGMAVVYPTCLREVEFPRLKPDIGTAQLRIAVVTEAQETGYVSADADYIERALRGAFEELVKEDVVAQAVAILDAGIERFASAMLRKPGVVGRMAKTLGIRDLPAHVPAEGEAD